MINYVLFPQNRVIFFILVENVSGQALSSKLNSMSLPGGVWLFLEDFLKLYRSLLFFNE